MTNSEKFKEVFGFTPDEDACVLPDTVCTDTFEQNKHKGCKDCPFYGWFKNDYKPCFVLREDLDDRK